MRPPNLRLRRLVAHLSVLNSEDVAAILGELDDAGRARVEALLQKVRDSETGEVAAPPPDIPAYDVTQVSAWLNERLEAGDGDGVTESSRKLLHACAVRLYPAPKRPARKATERVGKSWFGWGRPKRLPVVSP